MKEKIKELEKEIDELRELLSSKKIELLILSKEYAKSISKFKIGDKVIIGDNNKEVFIIKDITLYFDEPRYWYARIKKNGEPYNECRHLYFAKSIKLAE